jgi:hypothetical protein
MADMVLAPQNTRGLRVSDGHERELPLELLELSFRDGPKDQTRNLEIPGSMLRIAPE